MREPIISIPAQVLALPQGEDSSTPSILAQHITRSLADYVENGVPYDMERPIMEGLLAFAQLQPLNPRERVDLGNGKSRSLLDVVLSLHSKNLCLGVPRKWPASLEGFGPHLLVKGQDEYRARVIDSEWVAAVLVAAGANPWQEEPGIALPSPVLKALQFKFSGLLDRFLDCPGAPTPQVLLDAMADVEITPGRRGWASLACPGGGTEILKMLVERGLRLDDMDQAVQVLSEAAPDAIAVLAEASALPGFSDQQVAKLMQAWTQRVKSKHLSPSQVQQMQSQVTGRQAGHETATAMEIARMLTGDWGKNINLPANLGPKTLNRKSEVKRGPMAGQWSILAALAMAQLRGSPLSNGPYLWSVAPLFEHHHDNTKWVDADCHALPYKGSIASAIGFDWRPGITIDGVVVLAVIGQQPDIDRFNPENNDQQVWQNISDFGAAAAIADMRRWAVEHAPSAAAFTGKQLRAGMVKAAMAMLGAWRNAFHRVPEMAQALSPDQRLELLLSLTAGFELSSPWSGEASFRKNEIEAFQSVAKTLFPGLDTKPIEDLNASAERTAVLTYWLIFSDLKPLEKVARLRQSLPAPSKEEFALIGSWAKPAVVGAGNEAQGKMKATLLEWELEAATPVASSSRARGPRL